MLGEYFAHPHHFSWLAGAVVAGGCLGLLGGALGHTGVAAGAGTGLLLGLLLALQLLAVAGLVRQADWAPHASLIAGFGLLGLVLGVILLRRPSSEWSVAIVGLAGLVGFLEATIHDDEAPAEESLRCARRLRRQRGDVTHRPQKSPSVAVASDRPTLADMPLLPLLVDRFASHERGTKPGPERAIVPPGQGHYPQDDSSTTAV